MGESSEREPSHSAVPAGQRRAESAADGNESVWRSRERVVAAIALLFLWATFLLTQYDRMRTWRPGLESWIQTKMAGTLSEGDQFRIGLPFFLGFLARHAHVPLEKGLPLVESTAYGLALVLLYRMLMGSEGMRTGSQARRLAAMGLWLAAVQFPILWIFPWERPETLPTTFYLALVTWIVVHRERVPWVLTAVVLAGLSVAQGLTRGDAPDLVGAGIVVAALLDREADRVSRLRLGGLGVVCGVVGVATQKWLEHRFPLRFPGQTKMTFQLWHNLDVRWGPIHVPVVLTALFPLVATLWLARRYRVVLDATDRLLLSVCVLALPAYLIMGLVAEVRIYVPYLFLGSVAMAKIWSGYLVRE